MLYTRNSERLQQETKQLVTITVIGVNLSLCDLISVIITHKHTLNMNTQISGYDTSQGREETHPWPREELSFLGRGEKQMGVCVSCLEEIVWSKWHMMITDALWELMYLNVRSYDINIMLLAFTSMSVKPVICIRNDLFSSMFMFVTTGCFTNKKYTIVLPWCALKWLNTSQIAGYIIKVIL